MKSLRTLQFRLDSCGRDVAVAHVSDVKHPYYFNTVDLDAILPALEKRAVSVDKVFCIEDSRAIANPAMKAA